jgi:DNA-binding IclR family transcriptional regulator
MAGKSSVQASPEPAARRGVGAIGIGMQLVDVLASGGAMKLKDIAAAAGLPPPKAHRYLASLADAGMVFQADRSGPYELGPMALRVGVASMARHDVIQTACDALPDLRDQIRATCFVSGWGDRGPVILRWEDSQRPVTVVVKVGSSMPILTSATGRAFLAFLPQAQTGGLVAEEMLHDVQLNSQDRVDALIDETRRHGVGRVDGDFQAGIASLAAPLLSPLGQIAGVVTALGRVGEFDSQPDGAISQALLNFAKRLSGAGS